jgi:hypothetical protein
MSWEDIFPVLDNDKVARYQAEATEEEKARLREHFEVERVVNQRQTGHLASTSLFWKPAWLRDPDYPLPTKELMQDPGGAGLASRIANPWDHYVEPLLRAAVELGKSRPDVVLRVHLAHDLAFVMEELVAAGCEVALMKSSSLRASPGTMWRFLPMESGGLVTVFDADLAGDLLANIERTEVMAEGGLKFWRMPYHPGPGQINHGNPGHYRSVNASRVGASLQLPVQLLAEALLWNLEKGHLGSECTVGGRKIPYAGGSWPDYCFDEYFLNTAIFPRATKEGVLTMLSRRDTSQCSWFALDIEHCMKANPASEIIHFGQPWRNDVPYFSWSPEETSEVVEKLTEEGKPLISVCVALKNRSRVPSEAGILELFPKCVRGLAQLHEAVGPIELVIADFHSDDWTLEDWLEREAGAMKVHRLEMDGQFSRGRGMNAAVEAAESSQILIYDADMLMDETAFITGLAILAEGEEGTAFFPVIQNLAPNGNTDDWYETSFGMVFLPKETFLVAGGIPEFQNWGGEDEILYEKVAQISRVERFKLAGLNHQWHPISCRHLHYQGESHKDYRRYQAQRKREPGADFY